MIQAPFEYVRAQSVDHALDLLAEHGADAKLLAGGHSLLPMMKLRLAMPGVLVDIGRLADLSYARPNGEVIAVGALTRHAQLARSDVVRREVPLLAHVAGLVGDPQIRHRGTLGGSLVHADPAADLPVAVLALDGSLVLRGSRGVREVPAAEFFTGYFETVVESDEMLVEVRLPRPAGGGWAYERFSRRANDWAVVAAAVADSRVALANMGPTPLRATATEQALASGAPMDEAAALADQGTAPGDDMHADRDYRRHLARLLVRRALTAAASPAPAPAPAPQR